MDFVSVEIFDYWMEEFLNWGCWGTDDEFGTFNLIMFTKCIEVVLLV